MSAPSLGRLADELEQVARVLRDHGEVAMLRPISAGAARQPPPGGELAMRLYRERRRRDAAFESTGLAMAEPSWDMLLLLYAMQDGDRPLTASNVAEAGGNASTTGLRHLDQLERAGLIERTSDSADRRRTLVNLSDRGLTLMRLVLEGMAIDRDEGARGGAGVRAAARG
ncbi:MarR family winged helix-turn-helix transcriptional regulator [Sphingomonas bacterium]|uniref:MarR family winged helix-turn-helix transcriptional regulator n=1 Tax=Sphingomonas bacterium TaxID=1895847 RepID=UPI00157525B2|nr:winged helix DNA-binding protein [Sphingomonas bacterium]